MAVAAGAALLAGGLGGCGDDMAAIRSTNPPVHEAVTVPPDGKVHAAHILVSYRGGDRAKPTITRTKDEARSRAEEIRTMALAAGADFGALAKQYSDGPSGVQGGSLGVFGRGGMVPAFDHSCQTTPDLCPERHR